MKYQGSLVELWDDEFLEDFLKDCGLVRDYYKMQLCQNLD
jgi:hypothetical protein